jgi:hypothetical protein
MITPTSKYIKDSIILLGAGILPSKLFYYMELEKAQIFGFN